MLFLQKIVSNCFLSELQKLHPWRWQSSHLCSPLSLQGSMPLSPEGKVYPQGNCNLPLVPQQHVLTAPGVVSALPAAAADGS